MAQEFFTGFFRETEDFSARYTNRFSKYCFHTASLLTGCCFFNMLIHSHVSLIMFACEAHREGYLLMVSILTGV